MISLRPVQDQSQRRGEIVAPAVWLAEFLSEVNEHFAVKQLARSEFYSTALSKSVDVVWEYHAWRQAMVGTCLPFMVFTVTLQALWVAGCLVQLC